MVKWFPDARTYPQIMLWEYDNVYPGYKEGRHVGGYEELKRKIEQMELVVALKEHDVKVTFRKVNGDLREMLCTLQENRLPEHVLSENPRAVNVDQVRVFDLEKEEWRSFRADSVITWDIV